MGVISIHPSATADDVPLPKIRSVWIDTNNAPVNLGADSWTTVTLSEFQKIQSQAELHSQAEKLPPWMTQAHYEASITGRNMRGKALLHLNNPHAIKAWAMLSPWSPAIVPGRNDKRTRLRTGDNPQQIRALIDANRTQDVEIDFSVMGEQRADGTYFLLQLPACTFATMQIQLPAGYRMDWPGNGQFITGPLATSEVHLRRWDLTLSGQPRREILLVVREDKEQEPFRWMESRLDADFVVTQKEIQANYEIDLQCWHDRLRTVVIDWPEAINIESIQLKKLDAELPVTYERLLPAQLKLILPDSVDQRATIQLKGIWKPTADQRIDFRMPSVRDSQLTRSSIRIVNSYELPLIDWQWGDYHPTQAPQRVFSLDAGAEILTLTPQFLGGSKTSRTPSARLATRQLEIDYQEDNWWNISRQTNELSVLFRCSVAQGNRDFLSWRIPEGWQVNDVVSIGPAGRLFAWNGQPGKLLNVQLDKPLSPGQPVSLQIKLSSQQPPQFSEEPRIEYFPRLVPVEPGSLTGSYALSFSRSPSCLPPSFQVIKAPGQRVTPPSEGTLLWKDKVSLPDGYWQLQDQQASGTIQWQDWIGAARLQLRTEVKETRSGLEVFYRLVIRPRAGRITQWPVHFTGAVPTLDWKSSNSIKYPFQWISASGEQGKFVWDNPVLEETVLEVRFPWQTDKPVPLLLSQEADDIQLKVDDGWELVWNDDDSTRVILDSKDKQCWQLDFRVHSPRLKRKAVSTNVLAIPRLSSVVKNGYIENVYTVTVGACVNPLKVSIPTNSWLMEVQLDHNPREAVSPLIIPAADRSRELKIRYRQPVSTGIFYSQYEPEYPTWSSITSVPVLHSVQFDQRVVGLNDWKCVSNSGDSLVNMLGNGSSLYWISLESFILLMLCSYAGSFLICKYHAKWSLAGLLLVLLLSATLLPVHWWLLPVAGCLGVLSLFITKWIRSRYAMVMFISILLAGLGHSWMAAEDQTIELVFIIPDAAGNRDNARVMVPARLWSLLQSKAMQPAAGARRAWWISEARTSGELGLQQLRLTTQWNVVVEGTEPVDIPWLEGKSPQAVRLNGVPIQPRLVQGPFGLQQFAFRISEPGEHTLQIDWEVNVQAFRGMESALIKWPGAPVQTMTLKHVPSDIQVTGCTGQWAIREENQRFRLDADVGSGNMLNISWLSPQRIAQPPVADAAVLWEHRASESVAHAVIQYRLDNIWMENLRVNISLRSRLRNLNMVGELEPNVSPRIRSWNMKAAATHQELSIELQRPVTGNIVLLLELPWQRISMEEKIPLYGIEVVNVETRNRVVAYLLDGVNGKPDRDLVPVNKADADFARPWLPSLVSLPGSSFTRMSDFREISPSIVLHPVSSDAKLRTSLDIQLDMQELKYRYLIQATDRNLPLLYLAGQVDPGLKVQELAGDSVVRWHQTSVQPAVPSRLYLWLSGKNQSDQVPLCSILCRRPFEQMDNGRSRIPLYAIRWDTATAEKSMPITLRNLRSNRWLLDSSSPGLVEQSGPMLNAEMFSQWMMPMTMPFGSAIVLREEPGSNRPSFTRQWDENDKCWRFTLQAATDDTLSAELEFAVQNCKLEDDWQIEASVPLVARPVHGQANEIIWSVQLAKPVKRLQIISKPFCNTGDNLQSPIISFPAWPGLVSP